MPQGLTQVSLASIPTQAISWAALKNGLMAPPMTRRSCEEFQRPTREVWRNSSRFSPAIIFRARLTFMLPCKPMWQAKTPASWPALLRGRAHQFSLSAAALQRPSFYSEQDNQCGRFALFHSKLGWLFSGGLHGPTGSCNCGWSSGLHHYWCE